MDQPLTPVRAMEIELKFALSARYAARVFQHPAVERAASAPPSKERLLSVYYDTPKLDLVAAGAALRLRRSPEGWVQTLKWGGSALGGLHQRAEYEFPVAEQQLDLTRIDATELAPLFAPARVRKRLKPRFVTDFERTHRTLQVGASRIALSFDRGEIVAGKTRAPISELEIELVDGSTAALFDLAAELQQSVPLHPLSRSKAERGYALCGRAEAPAKAATVVLEPQSAVGQSFAVIVGSTLSQLQANEHGMLAGLDREYLHQMRVAVRRLRSAFGAHKEAMRSETFDMLRRELKWAGGRLGVARDWDVFATELLPPLLKERGGDAQLVALAAAAAEVRERANRSACSVIRSRRYARLILALARMAATTGTSDDPRLQAPAIDFASGLLEKRHDEVIERGTKLARRSAPELHALRIAAKKLRYASEFFGSLFEHERARPFRARVADLQESLGVINDQANMQRLVQAAMPSKAPVLEALVSGWSACIAHAERVRLQQAWQRFRHTRKFW